MLTIIAHLIHLSFFSLSSFQAPPLPKENNNYILLEFSDEHTEKPIPVIVFSVDSFYADKFSFVGYTFRVTRAELDKIEKVTQMNSSYLLLDSLAYRYYSVNVIRNGKKKIYGTINLRETKKLFDQIIAALNSRKDAADISRVFEKVSHNLHPR
jgi:hypothetical protein